MNGNNSVPNIRFKGFQDEWKGKELNSISKRLDNFRKPITANKRITGKTPYYGANGVQDYVKGYTHEGEFVLIAEDGANDVRNYPVRFVKGYIWVNNHAHVLQAKVDISNNLFLSYSLKNKNLLPYLVGSGRMKLNADVLMNLLLKIPSLKEQQKIGNFFAKLDKLLDLQQQKIDKLELLKKALLQKLFPKHDAKIPELRFKGFEDVWRKHRLKEVSKIIGGGTPDTKNPKYWNGNINWFSPNEIGNSPYAVSSHKKITDLGLKKSSAKLHPAEKTILFTSRAGIGDMAILTKPAATNQGFQSLELNNNVDSYFVYSYGFEIKKKANRLASGSTFLEISKNEMEKITLMFPSEQEQQRIGNLLSKVDQLIELENKKLQNFQQIKKCLLQNMFVE